MLKSLSKQFTIADILKIGGIFVLVVTQFVQNREDHKSFKERDDRLEVAISTMQANLVEVRDSVKEIRMYLKMHNQDFPYKLNNPSLKYYGSNVVYNFRLQTLSSITNKL